MSTIFLDQIDEHLLKQIVKKFSPTSGAGFYCSCRGAKDFVDRVKPVWHLPESKLIYAAGPTRTYESGIAGNDNFPNIPLEFSRIEKYTGKTNYIKTVVLPEVAAVGGVGTLNIWKMSDGDAQLLIAAAKPESVALWDEYHDPTSATFEMHVESYWRTTKLFQLAKNRRSIRLYLRVSSIEIIASFIENWLKGEKTGTLERLSFILRSCYRDAEKMYTIRKETEDLMKSHTKTEQGYIVERVGLDRLRVCADFDTPTIVSHPKILGWKTFHPTIVLHFS